MTLGNVANFVSEQSRLLTACGRIKSCFLLPFINGYRAKFPACIFVMLVESPGWGHIGPPCLRRCGRECTPKLKEEAENQQNKSPKGTLVSCNETLSN